MLGSNNFQVMENGDAYNLLSPTPPQSFDTYLTQPMEEKHSELMNNNSPPRNFEVAESPQKRRLSPDNSELDTSYKRRRSSSFIGFETPKFKFKEILKTPLDLFSRRKSISSTISCFDKTSLNESTVGTVINNDPLNQSCSSLQFVSTPVLNNTVVELKKDKFDDFKSPSSFNLFATPKHKSLFKKGFRKSFIADNKNSLKNIAELDPNCSIDDVDVSICESVVSKGSHGLRQAECSFTSLAPSASEAEGPATNFKLSSSRAIPVLTLFIFS